MARIVVDDLGEGGHDVAVQEGEDRVQVHVRAILGHHRRDHPLGRALGEQVLGDLLDHARLGALAHADQHRAVADRHHVAAFQRRPAEVLDVEVAVVAQLRVPEVEAGVLEHRVVAVDRQQVERFAPRAGQYIGLTETPL